MDRPTLEPPFSYFGGKTVLANQIAATLPRHEHYVEPFAGSLAVLLAKPSSRAETVNDLDGDLVVFWRVLRDQPDELIHAAMLTPHSREEYLVSSGDLTGLSDVERARRVWVRITQGRSHSMKPTGWRYLRSPVAAKKNMARSLDTFAQRMNNVATRIAHVSLENRSAIDVIQDYGRESSVCIYADPPYLGSTRASNYREEMLDDGQHEALANALRDCRASVVLSGYASPLYEALFDGWYRTEIKAPTTLSGDTDRVEVLWSNRPIGEPDLFGGAA